MLGPCFARIGGRLLRAGLVFLAVAALTQAASAVPLTNLVFDAETQEYRAKPGDAVATFTFQVTNVSDTAVHILGITASCSCTKAIMPETPWIIPPHAHEELHATMQLMGKPPGVAAKFLTIAATNGTKMIWVKSLIPPAMSDREKNQELAKVDRQAVFRGECANCHVERSKGLFGAQLYTEACGICHDSDHRATMVPELSSLNHPTDAAFWKLLIEEGKDRTLMPAFSQDHGGPLSNAQIESLVTYLTGDFPRDHKPTPQIPLPVNLPLPPGQPPHAELAPPPPPPGEPGPIQWIAVPEDQAARK